MNKKLLLIFLILPAILKACTTGDLTQIGTPDSTGSGSMPISLAYNSAFSYVASANIGNNTISIFKGQTNGALNFISSSSSGSMPIALTFSSDGKYLFVVNQGSNNLSVYSLSPEGVLTFIQNFNTGANPNSIVFVNLLTKNYLAITNYADNTVTIYQYNNSGQILSLVGTYSTGNGPTSSTYNVLQSTLAVTNSLDNTVSVLKVNADGSLSLINSYSTGTDPVSAQYSSQGNLLAVANKSDNTISIFKVSSGNSLTLSSVYNLPGINVNTVSFYSDGSLLLVTIGGDGITQGQLQVYSVNGNTLNLVTTINAGLSPISGQFMGNNVAVAQTGNNAVQWYGVRLPILLSVSPIQQTILKGDPATLRASFISGVGPFTFIWKYSYLDSNNNSITEQVVQPNVTTLSSVLVFYPTTISNVSVTVTDGFGCTTQQSLASVTVTTNTRDPLGESISNKYQCS